jgi:hypothetical protein
MGQGARLLAHAADRGRRHVRYRNHLGRRIDRADGDVGQQPRGCDASHRSHSRSIDGQRSDQEGQHGARVGLHGLEARDGRDGYHGRSRLHRLVHQQPHRGSARGGQGRARTQGGRVDVGRAGIWLDQEAGRGRGAGQSLQGCGLRVARSRLLDVPGHQWRHRPAGAADRLDVQPQLPGPSGARRAHALGEPGEMPG